MISDIQNQVARSRVPSCDGFARLRASPHWWITVSLVVAISILYYVLIDHSDFPDSLFYMEVKHDIHGSIYLVPFLYATAILGLHGAVAGWLLCFGAALPRIIYYSIGVNAEFNNTVFFAVPLMIALTILLELRWRARHARIAAERERERRLHLDQVFKAQENERRRIAQGLHDDVLQRLMAIGVLAENLTDTHQRGEWTVAKQAAELRTESLRLAEDLRRLSYDLRPSMLDSLGLVPAVDWLMQRLQQETGIRMSLMTRGSPTRLGPSVETKAFRIIQEALNNIGQHSKATEATVWLGFSSTRLTIRVSDNGVGFQSNSAMSHAAERGHLGLLGMRERVGSMNGALSIKSRAGGGTLIAVQFPLDTQTSALSGD